MPKKRQLKKRRTISAKRLQKSFGVDLPRAYVSFFESGRPTAFDGLVVKGEEIFFDEELLIWAFGGGTYHENTYLFGRSKRHARSGLLLGETPGPNCVPPSSKKLENRPEGLYRTSSPAKIVQGL